MLILCATDFSPSSHQAVKLAAALARRFGGRLTLLHVIEPLVQGQPYGFTGAVGVELDLKASFEAGMAGTVAELKQNGLEADAHVVFGSPAASILNEIRAKEPGLVVMGSHGRKGLARLFLGSVAASVIKDAGCPVLVTREDDVSERWQSGVPLRLAIGMDGTAASEATLGWLAEMPATVADPTVVRLYWPFQEAIHYGLQEPWLGEEPHPDLLPLLTRDVRALTARTLTRAAVPIRFALAHVNAAEILTSEAARLGADAIVVAVPPGRVEAWNALDAADVLRRARLPVFCIPAAQARRPLTIPRVTSVLIATDLSDIANAAIPPGYGVLVPGGRVELCHVHVRERDPSPLSERPPSPGSAPLGDEAREEITARLRGLIPPGAESHGIITNVSVIEGHDAAVSIVQAAERLAVDVIALGSHGRTGWKRALIGSVAEEVSRRSDRPVLIVHARRGAR